MAIKGIIWDIGGVLVRTEDRTPRTQLAESLGLTYAQLDDLVFNAEPGQKAQTGLLSTDEVWDWVAQALGQPRDNIPQIQAAFFAGDLLDEVLMEKIRGWHGRYRTGIITNAFDNVRNLIINEWRIQDAFDEIVSSAEAGIMKPDVRIFKLALHRLGVKAEESVFLDDFLHNVQGARAVGMLAIHFRSREQALRELEILLAQAGEDA